jgi:hypothetical protein
MVSLHHSQLNHIYYKKHWFNFSGYLLIVIMEYYNNNIFRIRLKPTISERLSFEAAFLQCRDSQAVHHSFPFLAVLGHSSAPSTGGQSEIIPVSSSALGRTWLELSLEMGTERAGIKLQTTANSRLFQLCYSTVTVKLSDKLKSEPGFMEVTVFLFIASSNTFCL